MKVVAIDEMKDRLLTLDQVMEKISSTEPLAQTQVHNDRKVYFEFEPEWAIILDELAGTDAVDAVVSIDGVEHQLTKDAALQAGAAFGLPGKYAQRLPSTLLAQQLNYWFGKGMGTTEFNMLTTGADQTVAAFAKPTITPFSNRALIETAIDGIRNHFGEEIYADYKFDHSLTRTDVRFIIPGALRVISGGGLADVPEGQVDEWAGGLHLSNSLIGKSQTKLETYMFRWFCTNGSTVAMPDMGVWSRRGIQDEMDVYTWAELAVNDVLGGLEDQFDRVQALTHLNVGSNVGDIVAEIFETFKVPVSQRRDVINTLVSAENLSMYTVQNAISQTANDPDLSADRRDKIMRISGALVGSDFNSIKAQIWAEGHSAGPTSPNPYIIGA